MKLLYGTTNKGKLQAMELAVQPLGIELISLNDLNCEIPIINECGSTPLENAELKARAYFEAFHIPVFSCDSGLYFDELSEAELHGGQITGQYRNAIYFILDEEHHYSSMDKSIATEPFILVTKPHEKRIQGFPLDSLSIDIKTAELL